MARQTAPRNALGKAWGGEWELVERGATRSDSCWLIERRVPSGLGRTATALRLLAVRRVVGEYTY